MKGKLRDRSWRVAPDGTTELNRNSNRPERHDVPPGLNRAHKESRRCACCKKSGGEGKLARIHVQENVGTLMR
jgi:hypothetical protein